MLTLERTLEVERYALEMVQRLPEGEGKMYGVLLVEDDRGQRSYLKAFSGKLEGSFYHEGWAPPMLDLDPTPLEQTTKARLQEIRERLNDLSSAPQLDALRKLEADWESKDQALREELQKRQAGRKRKRAKGDDPKALDRLSQKDSTLLREFKKRRKESLERAQSVAAPLHQEIGDLKRERKALSRALQAEMHGEFARALWADRPWSLVSLFPSGPPTGTGDCCAPKLLHWASELGLKPLALAEIWWGPDTDTRKKGQFYPPCAERCQPLLGALLSNERFQLRILHENDLYVALDKPSGLLTVPGAERWNQDCLQYRAQQSLGTLFSVHRLDLETSGVVLYAKNLEAQRELQKLFSERRMQKTYRAVLTQPVGPKEGVIDLALGPDPGRKGTYRPDGQGKEAVTSFRRPGKSKHVLDFFPRTGRSHQLRVHSAYALNSPILGDKLYGDPQSEGRLHLHACRLEFGDPWSGQTVVLECPAPF